MHSLCFFLNILPGKPCCFCCFFTHNLPFGNSHDLIMFFEKQLIPMILQSYLDILCSVCQLCPKEISSSHCLQGNYLQFVGKSGIVDLHRNAHSNLCTMSMIYEPSGFAFQHQSSPGAMKRWLRMDSLFGDFLLFSCQWSLRECTCPSQLSLWGLGGRNQGRRNNESSHCLQGIQTLLLSGGSSSLNPHFSPL